jgi:hypothetical protein
MLVRKIVYETIEHLKTEYPPLYRLLEFKGYMYSPSVKLDYYIKYPYHDTLYGRYELMWNYLGLYIFAIVYSNISDTIVTDISLYVKGHFGLDIDRMINETIKYLIHKYNESIEEIRSYGFDVEYDIVVYKGLSVAVLTTECMEGTLRVGFSKIVFEKANYAWVEYDDEFKLLENI